jgi:hypothetical protein
MLYSEKTFQKSEANKYGFLKKDDKDEYEKWFWSLRPDFIIQDENQSLLILLEAKGGEVPAKTWKHPKEHAYYQFLLKCKWPQKGFYYIIPEKFSEECKNCLTNDKHFEPSNVPTGLIYWEDLLPIIGDEIMKIALKQVLNEMKGLEKLLNWQKANQP